MDVSKSSRARLVAAATGVGLALYAGAGTAQADPVDPIDSVTQSETTAEPTTAEPATAEPTTTQDATTTQEATPETSQAPEIAPTTETPQTSTTTTGAPDEPSLQFGSAPSGSTEAVPDGMAPDGMVPDEIVPVAPPSIGVSPPTSISESEPGPEPIRPDPPAAPVARVQSVVVPEVIAPAAVDATIADTVASTAEPSLVPAAALPVVLDELASGLQTLMGLPGAAAGSGNAPAAPVSPLSLGMLWFAWRPRWFLFNESPTIGEIPQVVAVDGNGTGRIAASDPDGDQLTYEVVAGPEHGTVVVGDDGSFTYTATPGDAATTDSFEVRVSDEAAGFHLHGLDSVWALFTGQSPHDRVVTVAVAETSVVVGDPDAAGTVVGQVIGVPDGTTFSVAGATAVTDTTYELASGGTVSFADDGSGVFVYSPPPDRDNWANPVSEGFTIVATSASGVGEAAYPVMVTVAPATTKTILTGVPADQIHRTEHYVYWFNPNTADETADLIVLDPVTGQARAIDLDEQFTRVIPLAVPEGVVQDDDYIAVTTSPTAGTGVVQILDLGAAPGSESVGTYSTSGIYRLVDVHSAAIGDSLIHLVGVDPSGKLTYKALWLDTGAQRLSGSITADGNGTVVMMNPDHYGLVYSNGSSVYFRNADDGRAWGRWAMPSNDSAQRIVTADGELFALAVGGRGTADTGTLLRLDDNGAGGTNTTLPTATIESGLTDVVASCDGQVLYLIATEDGGRNTSVVVYDPHPADGGDPTTAAVGGVGAELGYGGTDDGGFWAATRGATADSVRITYIDSAGEVTSLAAVSGLRLNVDGATVQRVGNDFYLVPEGMTSVVLLRPVPVMPGSAAVLV